MAVLVADCPRCGAERMTFDVTQGNFIGAKYRWQRFYELFAICRHCSGSTIFVVAQGNPAGDEFLENSKTMLAYKDALNDLVSVERFISLRDHSVKKTPDYVPEAIGEAFSEGATCLTVECWNAAAAMFRLCVDLATRPLLPEGEAHGLNSKVRRDLGLRLPWLFQQGILPEGLSDLSTCIREDGNDGAHAGTLTKEDAAGLLDFTEALLERLYTEPERLRLAEQRRKERRSPKGTP